MSPPAGDTPDTSPSIRRLQPGQRCRVLTVDRRGQQAETMLERDDLLLEAPNWTLDGAALVLNGAGSLWRLDLDSRRLDPIELTGVPSLYNDHVLAPDGEHVYVSANDWHIYRAPLAGGAAERITDDGPPAMHFLHGVSPDGRTLAYVGLEPSGGDWWARAEIHIVPSTGGPSRRLTDSGRPADGCEYSPDGAWIYCNIEQFEPEPGHAQIARFRPDGSGMEQLTHDGRINWFPHLSPDGRSAVYLSFPPGTTGHPPDLPVELCFVAGDDWNAPVRRLPLLGGQGTINVNSWAPDGSRLAYVDYPSDPA